MSEDFRIVSRRTETETELAEKIERALTTIGIEWQANSSAICPVVTGRLAASITYATKNGRGLPNASYTRPGSRLTASDYAPHGRPKDNMVVVGTNVEYAQKIEEGGAREPQNSHFLRRGMTENISTYKRILKDELEGN